MEIKNIAVAGSGLMGGGIAQMFAENACEVKLWDLDKKTCEKGLLQIKKRLQKSVEKGKITSEDADGIIGRIKVVETIDELASESDLVIEAVLEDLQIKRDLFSELEKKVSPNTIFATNTSSLSVNGIAGTLKNTKSFLGAHFFNPPTKLALVEIVPTEQTDEKVIASVVRLLENCGKTPVTVHDSPGFIVNRLLLLLINEAARMYSENVASAEDIDTAMTLGALHPAGPLTVADLIGLDTCKKILDVLYGQLGSPSFKTAESIEKLVSEGKLGRKSGEGFFNY